MKSSWIAFAAGCFLASGLIESRGEQQILSGVAAVVDNEVVTFSEVEKLTEPREKAAAFTLSGPELVAEIRRIRADGVDVLIDRVLVRHAYLKLGIIAPIVPPASLEKQVRMIIQENCHGDPAAFWKWLEEQRRAAYIKK